MLCRTSKLTHPVSGVSLHTPLLVPSLSSKAFGFDRGQLDLVKVLDYSREFITKTCLISAYDIYYNYIPSPEDFPINVDLIFLDSGGFEVSDERDLSAVDWPVHKPMHWHREKLDVVISNWPEWLPAVLISYDHSNERKVVGAQMRDAKRFLEQHPGHLYSFLLKPQSRADQTLEPAIQALAQQVRDLEGFHFLGVTEKELGNSIWDRMLRIANLRRLLDTASLSMPIHVFGALDPLLVCLYFISGAEVFDGLTWCRYAYNSGLSVYTNDNSALKYGIEVEHNKARILTIQDNIRHLDQLERSLRTFAKTNDWSQLKNNAEFVRMAADRLESQLGRAD